MDGDTLCAEKGTENHSVLGERLFNLRRREVCLVALADVEWRVSNVLLYLVWRCCCCC